MKPESVRRYLPASLLLLLAVGLGTRTWFTGTPTHSAEGGKTGSPAGHPPRFKASDRPQETRQFPLLRKPLLVTTADELPITPEEAREEFAVVSNFDSERGRGRAIASLIRRLCRSGFMTEAFGMIDPAKGLVRQMGLEAFFLTASLDDLAILEKIRRFPDPDDRSDALSSYLVRIPFGHLRTFVAECGNLEEQIPEGLDSYFAEKLQSGDREEAVPLIFELHRQGIASDKAYSLAVIEDQSTDAFQKWLKLLKDIPRSPQVLRESWNYLLPEMTEENPRMATELILKIAPGDRRNAHLRYTLDRWLRKDRLTAENWIASQRETASPAQLDDIDWTSAVLANSEGHSDLALYHLGQIRDPHTKKTLSGIIGVWRLEQPAE